MRARFRRAEDRAHQQVFIDGHADEGMRHLKGTSDPKAASLGGTNRGDVLAKIGDLTAIGAEPARDEAEQGRLAGAVGADNADRIVFADDQVHIIGNLQGPETLADAVNVQKI
jgi:hypothetical protein